ncbi:MAG: hypothetical protein J7623_08035 [Chitinophaga sp.]|uniref:hypothetical protein n=1 Tax=Chitinophaga sp. TaxID=1869181 RepID=UPI001B2C0027|nr:hypothetical protein [Chitinophaga sp.]MBO9728570.1 hypothetical protein [Chitinophaga sp.]
MSYIVEHSGFVLLLFTFPLLGWFLHLKYTPKVIVIILFTAIGLLLPVFTGYSYVLNNAYGYLSYISLAAGYAYFLTKGEYKFAPTGIFSLILFLFCGVLAFMGGFLGSITVEKEWRLKGYRVTYVKDQGFAGSPLLTYQLSKYGMIPIFVKEIQVKRDDDTTGSCWIEFDQAGFNFNKCSPDSSVVVKRR